jgi:hypothetical protein
MKVPQGTMIGTVLTTTIKTVLVGTFVRVRQLVVEPIVRIITVVFIIVSKCGHDGSAPRILSATRKRHAHWLANQAATSIQNGQEAPVQNEKSRNERSA